MKRFAALLLMLTALMLCLTLTACGGRDDGEEFNDDLVISTRYYFKNGVYFNAKYKGDQLGCAYFSEPGKTYFACQKPLCSHSFYDCPTYSFAITATLTVTPEGRDLPVVYILGWGNPMKYVDGELQSDPDAVYSAVVRAFDTETGETTVVSETGFNVIKKAWYYDGKIYLWAENCHGEGASCRVGMVDVATGESSCIVLGEKDHYRAASGLGVSGGRFYFIDVNGMVYSSDLDLEDVREEYDCGVSPIRDGYFTPIAYVDHGMLYFERNARLIKEMTEDLKTYKRMVADVYAVDLNDKEAGERLVAENVGEMLPYKGDLYYTTLDYKEYGINDEGETDILVISLDGGTLYRYDRESGASETCFTDCGMSFHDLYDIADGKLIFEGIYYREVYPDPSTGAATYNYMCVCDLETGKWDVLSQSETIE